MSNAIKTLSIFDNARAMGKVTYKNMTRRKAVEVFHELNARGLGRQVGDLSQYNLVEKGSDLVMTYEAK